MSTELFDVQPLPTTYRDYSIEFKTEALVRLKANNSNVLRTANELGIPEPTLRMWVRYGIGRHRELYERKSAELASNFEEIAFRVTELAEERLNDPEKSEKINFTQLMTGGAIATDKSLLLRGQPTSIIASSNNDLSELLSSVQAIAHEQRLTEHEAALRLAAQLADVPELAAMLREWAEGEQARKSLVQPDVVTTTLTSHKG